MSMFITRVELHDANYSDYQTLHAAMDRIGFSRTIKGSDGYRYHLPTAEYYIEGQYTGESVRDAAKQAADSTGKRSAVLTTTASAICWTGLPKVA